MPRLDAVALAPGITLAVEHFGRGCSSVPLVVIHGGPSWSHDYLRPGLELVGRTLHVIAPDLRGCGSSTRHLRVEQYQPELAVQDVIDLLDHYRLPRVDLLGFSTGGQWAQLLVERYPDRVRRLILASTTAYGDLGDDLDAWPEFQRRCALVPIVEPTQARRPDVPPGEAGSALDDDAALNETIAWAYHDAPRAIWDLSRLDEYLQLLDATTFTGDWLAPFELGLLHPHRPVEPERVLADFGGPILILHGRFDMGFPVSVARRLHRAVPGSRLAVIDDCGHQASFEKPVEWSTHIIDFLTDQSLADRFPVDGAARGTPQH